MIRLRIAAETVLVTLCGATVDNAELVGMDVRIQSLSHPIHVRLQARTSTRHVHVDPFGDFPAWILSPGLTCFEPLSREVGTHENSGVMRFFRVRQFIPRLIYLSLCPGTFGIAVSAILWG